MSSFSTAAKSGICTALLAVSGAVAQPLDPPAPPLEQVTDSLVAEALVANLGLAGAEAEVAQKLAALDQARARFLPVIDLSLRYSRAEGGREVEFPVGDLLNPAYAALNSLLAAAGQPAPFVPVANAGFRFLREREQDSSIALRQPLYDARLPAARDAARHEYDAARHGLAAYRLRLARDLRQAYYRWLAARDAIAILEATRELARENERVNGQLWRNGKVTRDLVLRAEADLLEVEQQLLRAQATELLARRYVNLLRNVPLDSGLQAAVVADADVGRLGARIARGDVAERQAVERRAELRQLDSGLAAAAAAERVASAAFRPQLALAVDAGTQGPRWGHDDDDAYVLASLVLRFNLSRGGADRAALREARARSSVLAAGRELAEQRVRIEVSEALADLEVAEASLQAAARRAVAAGQAFEIVARKRDLGQVPPAEFLDARRALTEARLNAQLTRLDALAALAQLEFALGGGEQGS